MDQTSLTAAGAIDPFLVLLIGIGPKIALVPFLEMTASLDDAAKQRVLRKMMTTAATTHRDLVGQRACPRHGTRPARVADQSNVAGGQL